MGRSYVDEEGNPKDVWLSSDRVVTMLNIWAKFFASSEYSLNMNRAREFLVYSLRKQLEYLEFAPQVTNLESLHERLLYYERFSLLPLIGMKLGFSREDESIIREYLKTTIAARKKLELFYPEHRALIEDSKRLLRSLEK